MTDTPAPTVEIAKPMSFTDKLVGVFSSPGELYENVRQTPPTSSNWVLPTIILIVVGLLQAMNIAYFHPGLVIVCLGLIIMTNTR